LTGNLPYNGFTTLRKERLGGKTNIEPLQQVNPCAQDEEAYQMHGIAIE